MIKNNESKIQITSKNIKYYSDRGYLCEIGNIISIDVSNMPKMSGNIITAICEICQNESNLQYCKYNKNVERGGFYSCKRCSNVKRKKTNFELYGVENITQRLDLREKNKIWMSSEEFRKKSENTQIEKYGCLYTQRLDFRKKNSDRQKNIISQKKEIGEYECPLSNPENRELREAAFLKKYGHTYSFYVDDIKKKIQETNLKKYGHISPFGNKEIQENIKNNKIQKISEHETFFNGYKYKTDLFKIYRRKVRYKTGLLKTEILKKWDGYDYYDGEYIKDNFNLDKNNINYPTIDHKISCFYGFINNLNSDYISDISNICITKRYLNTKKGNLNEYEFIHRTKK